MKNFNRRSFLTKSLGTLGAIGLLPSAIQSETQTSKDLLHRTLGKTGIRLPVVSMGVMNASIPDVLAESYKRGVRHFDTAWYYQRGRNEQMVGDVINRLNARKEVTIATKIFLGDMDKQTPSPKVLKETFLKRFDESLSRLRMDYVDILYYHNVYDPAQIQMDEINDALNQIKKQGKARFIGISVHANIANVIQEALTLNQYDVILAAYNFAMANDEALQQALEKAALQGIGLIAMKTQAGGGWWREGLQKTDAFNGPLNQTAMLKWVLNHPFFTTAIPGYTNFQHMEEDLSVAFDLNYTKDEIQFLNNHSVPVNLGYCHQCGECVQTCRYSVDIPKLMRTHMYAYQYGNLDHAYSTYQELSQDKNLTVCQSCTNCTARCSNYVQIGMRIQSLNQLNLAMA